MDNLTSKQRYEKVIERSKGLCELCYSPNTTQIHHIIFGKGKRKQCETVYSLINLCWECHQGTYGVHGREGAKLDLELKQELQRTYEGMGMSEDEVRRWLGGKLYL